MLREFVREVCFVIPMLAYQDVMPMLVRYALRVNRCYRDGMVSMIGQLMLVQGKGGGLFRCVFSKIEQHEKGWKTWTYSIMNPLES